MTLEQRVEALERRDKPMLTIEFKKGEGLTVKHNGQILDGVKEVKINTDSSVYDCPEVTLTIKPAEIKVTADIICPETQSGQQL